MYTDTAFCHHKYKSPRGSIGCQLFGTDFGWSRAFPLPQKKDAHEALSLVFRRDGVPHKIVCDGAKESKNSTFHKKSKEAGCGFSVTEPYSPWQNTCEREIREVKKGVTRTLVQTEAPIRTWDWCMEWESAVRSLTALDIYQLNGRVPHALISGETPDISQYCEFGFWQWVKFRDNTAHWMLIWPDNARSSTKRPTSSSARRSLNRIVALMALTWCRLARNMLSMRMWMAHHFLSWMMSCLKPKFQGTTT
jgi:hypothetical protein